MGLLLLQDKYSFSYPTFRNGATCETPGVLTHADLCAHAVFYLYWFSASRGDKKGEKRVTGPKGLSEGKHRIRGNKRITNTGRWHVYLLGIVWKIGERDKKVNSVKTCGGSRKREGGRALCMVHRWHLTNQWTGRSGSHTNWCCCPRWPRCEAGRRHGWKRMRECWQKQGSSHGQRIPWQHWPEARI